MAYGGVWRFSIPFAYFIQETRVRITNLSNMIGRADLSLRVALGRELVELMGGNPSRLHKWGKDLGLPVPSARQSFYSHLEHGAWKMESRPASTETCRLGSYPMNCELRLRVVSLVTQFTRDMREGKQRQVIVLLGYEVCSHLIHFKVYRGDDVEVREHEKIHGIRKCVALPVATVAAFVKECGRMVGLPLRRVLLTQNLMDFEPVRGKASLLSLTALGKVTAREWRDEIDENEVLCSFGSATPYQTLEGNHPFVVWCETSDAAKLTARLSDLVKRHYVKTVLARLETAQRVLDFLLTKAHNSIETRRGDSRWKGDMPPSALEARLKKHDYALERYSLREVRFYRRQYEKFNEYPGDCTPGAD